ncbi:hypothetical protein P4S63_04540 [Pseudoalteromonas sp. B193]
MIDWVSNLSINMQHYDEANYVQGDYLMEGFKKRPTKWPCSG